MRKKQKNKKIAKRPTQKTAKAVAKFRWLVWVCASLLCALGGLLWLILGPKASDGQVVGTVNGLPFYYDELAMYASEERSAIAANFAAKYGLDSFGGSFWDTEYEGTTPRQVLYKKALDALIRNKVIQQEAIARGIVAPANYRQMLAAMPSGDKSGGYGPNNMNPAEYNSYLMTYAIDDLKAALLQGELAPSEADERTAFATLPDSLKQIDFTARGFVCLWAKGAPSPKATLQSLLVNSATPAEALQTLAQTTQNFSYEPFELISTEVHREDTSGIVLADAMALLAPGEMLELSEKNTLYYITQKEGGGLLTYEQAPNLGRNKWINDRFEIYIDEKVAQAVIDIYGAAPL